MKKKIVKVYISTYLSIIAILIALLAIYFKTEAYEKNIERKDAQQYPDTEQYIIYEEYYIFGSEDANAPGIFNTFVTNEIYIYSSVITGYLTHIDINSTFSEIVKMNQESPIELESFSNEITIQIEEDMTIGELSYDYSYYSEIINYGQYDITFYFSYTNTTTGNLYDLERKYERYVQDYGELYNQFISYTSRYGSFTIFSEEYNYNLGYSEGYIDGYENGQENGNNTGYEEGYNDGVRDTINDNNDERFSLEWLEPLFRVTTDFLNIEILPGFKIIHFVAIPLFFSFVYMILKLFR